MPSSTEQADIDALALATALDRRSRTLRLNLPTPPLQNPASTTAKDERPYHSFSSSGTTLCASPEADNSSPPKEAKHKLRSLRKKLNVLVSRLLLSAASACLELERRSDSKGKGRGKAHHPSQLDGPADDEGRCWCENYRLRNKNSSIDQLAKQRKALPGMDPTNQTSEGAALEYDFWCAWQPLGSDGLLDWGLEWDQSSVCAGTGREGDDEGGK